MRARRPMGFDAVWFVEHHFLTSFSMSPCPEVIFGALSRLTKRIRLGFGVVILPYHHPVRVAERVAMVDHLSGGRVEFGTGRSAAYEQTGHGHRSAPHARDVGRVAAHDPQDLGGRRRSRGRASSGTSRRATCGPKPYQKPHPAIWVAALQPATYQLAAEKGIGVMALSVASPSFLARTSAVQGARPPRQAGRQVRQRPVAELHHGPCADRTTRRRASWPRNRCAPSSGPIARTSRTRRTSTSSSSSRGAACPSICRRTSRATSRRKAARTGAPEVDLSGGSGQIASAPVEPDRRRYPGRSRRPRGRRSRELPQEHRHSRGRPASTSCSS